MCKELSVYLDSAMKQQDEISKDDIYALVDIAINEVKRLNLTGETDAQAYKGLVSDQYREIALETIGSYASSNEMFERIYHEHTSIIQADFINIEDVMTKFNDVQSHLNREITRANSTISNLRAQINNLEAKTLLDPLTKAYNRYALQEHLFSILSKIRSEYEVYVLMIDIDDFKTVNETFGHIAGDKVLIFITKILKASLRDGDRVYRLGGEEFLILLNRTDENGAQMVAERILNLTRTNKPLFQNQQVPMSLSIGLTKIQSSDTADSILERADFALCRAKNNGKDCIEAEF